MRVIGGTLKGRVIVPPSGFKARPTTDFAKEGLFNMLDNAYDLSTMRFNIKGMHVVRHNVFDFLNICKLDFDIVFADPPYDIDGLDTIPDKVFNAPEVPGSLLREGGLLILEHPGTYSFTTHPHFDRERKYGNVHFSFFKKVQ